MVSLLKMTQPLIVIGCHRSGTSLLSHILHQNGIFMGDDQNEHYESTFFFLANKMLLKSLDATWDHPETVYKKLSTPDTVHNLKKRVQRRLLGFRLFNTYGSREILSNSYKMWGWKDPRSTLFLPIWLALFPRAKILHIHRHGIDVANSIRTRERKRDPEEYLFSARGLELRGAFHIWQEYEKAALHYTKKHPHTLRISFEELTLNTIDVVTRLQGFIERDVAKLPVELDTDRAFSFCYHEELRSFHANHLENDVLIQLGYVDVCD